MSKGASSKANFFAFSITSCIRGFWLTICAKGSVFFEVVIYVSEVEKRPNNNLMKKNRQCLWQDLLTA
jgi:lipoprotein